MVVRHYTFIAAAARFKEGCSPFLFYFNSNKLPSDGSLVRGIWVGYL